MMKMTGLSHLFKWENLHNWWLTKYFFAPLYVCCVPNVVSGFTETVMIILNQWDNRLGDNYKWVNVITIYTSIKNAYCSAHGILIQTASAL